MPKGKCNTTHKVRTKGNFKPSNSDRASEFLQRNILSGSGSGLLVSLSTYDAASTLALTSASQSAFSTLLPLDQDPVALTIDSDFLNVLRKLEKRSGATKQKALDTLIDLLRSKADDVHFVKSEDVISASVLPFWPRLFNDLACDEDRRVRELSQIAMHSIAKRLGRKISPCLKEIVITWTFATVDLYDNISRAAIAGLSDTFPGDKIGELYRRFAKYLLDECDRKINYLDSELPLHLKFKKNQKLNGHLPPDAHHHLNISTQFLSWVASFLPHLCKLPEDDLLLVRFRDVLLRIWPPITPILEKVKFAPLRSSYYNLMSTMCLNMTEWIISSPDLLNFVLEKCLQGEDVCLESLGAFSTCLSVFRKEVWTWISWKELVNTTLIPMIEQVQTKAQRTVLYLNLLPLVSHLPIENILAEDADLMKRFLVASREGLLRSLNIPVDADLHDCEAVSCLQDHGSSIECLKGLFEVSRFLLDCAALSSNEDLTEYLCNRVFLDFMFFALTFSVNKSSAFKRWMYREKFSDTLFKQISCTLGHLVRDSRSQLQDVFANLKDSITELLKSTILESVEFPLQSISQFLWHISETGTHELWCQTWLSELLTFIRPDSSDFPHRWLLTFILIGRIESSLDVENSLDLLISAIIPAFEGEDFIWSDSMNKGLAKCSLEPFSVKNWHLVSSQTRRRFIAGPLRKLALCVNYEKIAPLLQFFVNLLINDLDGYTTEVQEFASLMFEDPLPYDEARELILQSLCKMISDRERVSEGAYTTLSLMVNLVISCDKLSLTSSSELINQYVRLSLEELWNTRHSKDEPSHSGEQTVAYLNTLEESQAKLFSQKIWLDVLGKIKSNGCPKDSGAILNLLSQLTICTDTSQEVWLNEVVSSVTQLATEIEALSQELPIFVRTEVFPIHLLPRIAPIIVQLQLGLKLNLHKSFKPHEVPHKRLASALLTLHFWLSTGTIEPFILSDISSNSIFIPTKEDEFPSINNLLSYLDGMCSEVVDAVYTLEHFPTSNCALRAALARRLVGIHPQKWPLDIKEAATCSPPQTWMKDQVTDSSLETFMKLCEVCIPVGILRRCLPRSVVITHVQEFSSRENLSISELTRLLELIASLSSVVFVGSCYSFSLSPIALEDIRDPLVEVEDEQILSSDRLRAIVASMKTLQTLVLLRQPVRSIENAFPGLGLASLSIWLRKTKPRLTGHQWDSLLCLVASWVVQAVVRPVKPTAFPVHTFRLVAAIGSLFVNSVCASSTISSALIRKETASVKSVDELMKMNSDEWDETDFDFAEDYDCEDDGSVVSSEVLNLLDDDFTDVDDEEIRFDDPNALRRLPPPANVQRDWQEFFAHEIFRSLICLSTEMCLYEDGNKRVPVLKDTPPQLASLCAAMATCSVDTFLTVLQKQSDIVVAYLLDNRLSSNCLHSPMVKYNLFSTECFMAPLMQNSLDLTLRFISTSSYQSGQLLGHILLSRLVSSRSLQPVRRMSDVLIPHLPRTWVIALTTRLTDKLEGILGDPDTVVSQWGRGMFSIEELLGEDIMDGHQRLLSYLLAWDGIVSLLSSASQQSRACFQAALLTDDDWIEQLCRLILTLGLLLPKQAEIQGLLNTPCRLEPDVRLLLTSSARAALNSKMISTREVDFVFAPLDGLVHLPGHRLTGDLRHLAVWLLRRLLSESPALMRSLYAEMQRGAKVGKNFTPGQARQLSSRLEQVVRSHFSCRLITDEVEAIDRRANEFKRRLGAAPYLNDALPDAGSIDIKGRPLSREITTTYHFSSDQSLEMIITLPENFPLSPVNVATGSRTGTFMSNWRAYIVLLSVFINNQNGSVLEGIGLWLRNLKKKFEGVEECPICYSVIHDRDFSFPKMQCRVCKKKFHSNCMYRYFQTSHNPTCPLCRSLFYTTRS
ncbi:unnamed protein product [Rodentolepis nana]|uniref:E3 ubiquitin-protein ligase listerin n=1 Tax=Rodentolepis nana TaxID=102285 RepID=A0A0R3TLF9_RODNA|nr:unnamed protein product [Rodentolepis nana]